MPEDGALMKVAVTRDSKSSAGRAPTFRKAPRQGISGLRSVQRRQSGSPHSFFCLQKWQHIPACKPEVSATSHTWLFHMPSSSSACFPDCHKGVRRSLSICKNQTRQASFTCQILYSVSAARLASFLEAHMMLFLWSSTRHIAAARTSFAVID